MHTPDFDENEVLRDALSGLNDEVPPMPEGLHDAWKQKVEDDKMEKTITRKTLTRFLSIAAALVFVVGGTLLTRNDLPPSGADAGASLGAARTASYDLADEDAAYEDYAAENGVMYLSAASQAEYSATVTTAGGAPESAAFARKAADKKIIRTASMTLRTQDFQADLAALRSLCEGSGGWAESISESQNARTGLRTAYLTLRIPQTALDGFLAGTEDCGRVTARAETATDVTAAYQDTQIRLDTQQALMERLQALIPESANLSDLLALESQIAQTQYQIDTLTASLADTDRQVAYSTVSITLIEEAAPAITDGTVSLGERIGAALEAGWTALTGFLQDMLVFLVAALPFLGVVAAVAIVVVIIIRKFRRRNPK